MKGVSALYIRPWFCITFPSVCMYSNKFEMPQKFQYYIHEIVVNWATFKGWLFSPRKAGADYIFNFFLIHHHEIPEII